MRGAAKDIVKRQLVHLRHDSVSDRLVAVAQVASPQATHTIQHLVAIDVPNPTTFTFGNDVRRGFFHRPWVRHWMPNVLCVIRLELVVVHVVCFQNQS